MQQQDSISSYQFPLRKIKEKVNKKNGKHSKLTNELTLYENTEIVRTIINDFGEKIIRVDGEIPKNLTVNPGDRFLFISYHQSLFTHSLHKYPAKFFPELPRWFIKKYSKKNSLIIDPFMGSGTTNVEALLSGRNSYGIDVDPFSRFLTKVKVTPLNQMELIQSKKELLSLIRKYNPSKVQKNKIPDFPYRDNWFNEGILYELAYIKQVINNLNTNDDIKDFFNICFSSIIRGVSNADNNCTRTVIRKKLNKIVLPSDALTKFIETILLNIPKMIAFSSHCPQNISVNIPENMDARKIDLKPNTFDLAITSPPYVNAVDYPRTHQLESYWLGMANGSLTPLKRKHVGTESVSSEDYIKLNKINIRSADKVILKIFEKDPRRAFIAYKYLADMENNLREIHKILRKNGRYIIVVGNNNIRGQIFENWRYIWKLAERVGFKVENYFASEIINHFIKVPRGERINTDWILILRK